MYWRDIPAQVIAEGAASGEGGGRRRGGRNRRQAKRVLPRRFGKAIDAAAMQSGATGTEAYLNAWKKGDAVPCGDDIAAVAKAEAARLAHAYPSARVAALVANGGYDKTATNGTTA